MVIPEQGVARGRSSESLMRVSDSRLWGPALLCSDFKGKPALGCVGILHTILMLEFPDLYFLEILP